MAEEYYPLPLPFSKIISGKEISKCDLKTSIGQKIHLILITFMQENRFNRTFGCEIWEYDFENIYNMNGWKDQVCKSISETIIENEKRLGNIQVAVDISQEEVYDKRVSSVRFMRKRLDVRITGSLMKTNESFYFSEPIYVSPISLD